MMLSHVYFTPNPSHTTTTTAITAATVPERSVGYTAELVNPAITVVPPAGTAPCAGDPTPGPEPATFLPLDYPAIGYLNGFSPPVCQPNVLESCQSTATYLPAYAPYAGSMSQDVTDCARTADTINSAPASTNWSPILGQPVNAERGYSARRAVKPKGNNISERMRRWRRENAEKNRMNDLRCRVYRQARIRFGRESTPEKETWIQHEIARRLERQRQGRVAKVENRGGNHTSSSSLYVTGGQRVWDSACSADVAWISSSNKSSRSSNPTTVPLLSSNSATNCRPNRHQRDMPTNLSRFPGLKFINMLHDGRTVYSYASPMTPDQGLGLPNLPDLTTSVPTGSLPSSNASASLTITQSIPAVFVMPSLEDTLGYPFQLPAPDHPIEDDSSSSSSSSGGSDTVLPSLSTYHQQSICPGVSTTPANVAPAETEVGGDSFSLVSTPTTIIAAGTADSQDEPIGYLSAAYSSQDLL